jgi:hypothetical protein
VDAVSYVITHEGGKGSVVSLSTTMVRKSGSLAVQARARLAQLAQVADALGGEPLARQQRGIPIRRPARSAVAYIGVGLFPVAVLRGPSSAERVRVPLPM